MHNRQGLTANPAPPPRRLGSYTSGGIILKPKEPLTFSALCVTLSSYFEPVCGPSPIYDLTSIEFLNQPLIGGGSGASTSIGSPSTSGKLETAATTLPDEALTSVGGGRNHAGRASH